MTPEHPGPEHEEHPDHAVGSGLSLEKVIEMLIDGEFTGW